MKRAFWAALRMEQNGVAEHFGWFFTWNEKALPTILGGYSDGTKRRSQPFWGVLRMGQKADCFEGVLGMEKKAQLTNLVFFGMGPGAKQVFSGPFLFQAIAAAVMKSQANEKTGLKRPPLGGHMKTVEKKSLEHPKVLKNTSRQPKAE